MPRDAELDRLKAQQDAAFSRKQQAYDNMQQAWERRSTARDALERAHAAKQSAYEVQDESWQRLKQLRDYNSPRIESLNEQQERAFSNMQDSFERASSAYESGDGASASSYAFDGRRYKQESQDCVAERRRLVQELRDAKVHHESTRPDFQRAKATFDQAKRDHDSAKAEHERKRDEFRKAKTDFDAASKAFKARLEFVRVESQRRRKDKRSIAERAGVPYPYLDNVWVSHDRDGTVNIYFGGMDKPNGLGHGHYVMDRSGTVTYRRNPFDPHGSQNFTAAQDASLLYTRSARSGREPQGVNEHGGVFYRRNDQGGTSLHITQFFDDGYHVSWDATPQGNYNVHWTNHDLPAGHPERFIPPDDALI